ncbi:MAG: hypothetical protein IPP51_05560 [Bacteroidetes bacterium]|nr:hypothetical protein [Bacteroidota bacterium]
MSIKTAWVSMIVIGIIMMIYTGFDYSTTKKVADIGPIKINKETDHPVRWSPIVGAVLILGGVVVMTRDKKAKS